jgi:hypothetical protein
MIDLAHFPRTAMKISTQSVSQFAPSLLARLALSVGVCGAAIAIASSILPQSALAQAEGTVNPLQDFSPAQNERDSLGGSLGGDGGFSVFDLIHRAQTGGSINFDEFSTKNAQEIESAADAYRREQLRRLNQQQSNPQQAPSGETVTTPQTAN